MKLCVSLAVVCQLGLGEYLVGISHECDYPAEDVKGKPVLVDCALNLEGMSMGEIDKVMPPCTGNLLPSKLEK
jgi:hypothetical protein